MLSSPQPSPVSQFANTSETSTSDRCCSKDLSQILVDIKSCRWRHFRPRTPPLHDSDSDELSSRRSHRNLSRAGAAQPGTHTCSASTQSKSSRGSTHCGTYWEGGGLHPGEGTVVHPQIDARLCSIVFLPREFVSVAFFNHSRQEVVCYHVFTACYLEEPQGSPFNFQVIRK